jgi:MFS family permease
MNKNFLLLWIGGTISRMGQVLLLEGFGLWIVFDLVKNPASATGAVKVSQLAAFLGLLTFGVFAGVFVDRWANKQRILVITSACRSAGAFLGIVAAVLLLFLPTPPTWLTALALASIYLSILLVNTFTHFAIPASYAIFVDCVDPQDYAYANGLLLTATFASILVGTVLALQLFATFGIISILVLCSAMYLVSFITSSNIKVEIHPVTIPRARFVKQWWESIVFCLKVPGLTLMLAALVLINIWNGALTMLANPFISQNLHVAITQAPIYDSNNTFYGPLGVSIEIAFIVGSLFFGLVSRRLGQKRVFSYALLIEGLLMIVVSRFSQYIPALVMIFLISVCSTAINVIAVPIYLEVTPWHFLGRVRSIVDVTTNVVALIAGATCLGLLNTGVAAFHAQIAGISFTFIDTVLTLAGVFCLIGGIVVVRRLKDSTGTPPRSLASLTETPDSTDSEGLLDAREPSVSGKA